MHQNTDIITTVHKSKGYKVQIAIFLGNPGVPIRMYYTMSV